MQSSTNSTTVGTNSTTVGTNSTPVGTTGTMYGNTMGTIFEGGSKLRLPVSRSGTRRRVSGF